MDHNTRGVLDFQAPRGNRNFSFDPGFGNPTVDRSLSPSLSLSLSMNYK